MLHHHQKKRHIIFAAAGMLCLLSTLTFGQNQFEKQLKKQVDSFLMTQPPELGLKKKTKYAELYPSDAPTSLLTPTGFGGSGMYVFGGLGGAYPEVYTNSKTDLIASVGVCIGNPVKLVNFAASLNITDVSSFRDLSGNFILSRKLFKGTSISAGALQMFASHKQSDAPGSTFYTAVTHAVQTIPSLTPGCSRLSYTIGIGSGRFYEKSGQDIKAGRGKHGTAVFGSVAFEPVRHVSVNAEWTGTNLGFSAGVRPFKMPVSLAVGVTNVTRYSAEKANMVFSLGVPLNLTRFISK